MRERRTIGPLAKAYRIGRSLGYPDRANTEEGQYNKVEYYALLSVLIDKVIDKALQNRGFYPPFGLITTDWNRLDTGKGGARVVTEFPNNPFQSLKKSMKCTLNLAHLKLLEDLRNQADTPLASIYQRCVQLLPEKGSRISDGIETASDIMSAVLEVIPRLCDDDYDISDWIQIAQNSYPLLAKLASLHLTELEPVGTKIRDKLFEIQGSFMTEEFHPFDTTYFCLEGKEKLRLTPSQKLLSLIERITQIPNLPYVHMANPSPTIGCPALVNFKEGSAIKRLWDWHVDLAPHLYALDTSTSGIL